MRGQLRLGQGCGGKAAGNRRYFRAKRRTGKGQSPLILSGDRNINRGTGGRECGTAVAGRRDSRRHDGPTGLRINLAGRIGVAAIGKAQSEATAHIRAVAFQQVHRAGGGRDRACRCVDGIAHATGAADVGRTHDTHTNDALRRGVFELDRILLLRRGRLNGAHHQIRRGGFRQHAAAAIDRAGA